MIIKGTVQHQALSGGFWGIIGDDGQKWKPVNMPKALQKEGLKVEVEAEKSANVMSIFMWGTNIDIKEHKVL
jgi:hypothetical protein